VREEFRSSCQSLPEENDAFGFLETEYTVQCMRVDVFDGRIRRELDASMLDAPLTTDRAQRASNA
jgi:hypothetical protein